MTTNLTSANKNRHAKNVRVFLEKPGTMIMSRQNVQQRLSFHRGGIPRRYMPVKRVGSSRTADGVAFVLEDPTKVGKLIFFKDAYQRRRIINEYEIGKRMGELGIGPRVYDFYFVMGAESPTSVNLLRNALPGKTGVYIIMQNLANGASDLKTLYDHVKDGRPYPFKQIKLLLMRMKKAGVLHGDLHAKNILVKTFAASRKVRVYFIDYGRSITVPPTVADSRAYMFYVKRYTPSSQYPNFLVSPTTGTLIGNNARILERNRVLLKHPEYIQRKRREGRAKTVARSVKRHSPLY